MKIITKSNFNDELFVEQVVCENIHSAYALDLINLLNEKHHTEFSSEYYALVEDDYKPYDGYKEVYGEY